MANLSAQEQFMLELVNRARMDPAAEAARYGITLNQGLPAGTITATPKQVLAGDSALALAADNHSNWMLTNDIFDHFETSGTPGFTGVGPGTRMAFANYGVEGTFGWGENISWTGSTGAIDLTAAIESQHRGLFLSPGHRTNILGTDFREIGIGQVYGQFTSSGTTYNASMVTQAFATIGAVRYITGVVYNDTSGNDFFTVGEQTAGRTVTGSGASNSTTGAGGGYELEYSAAGTRTVGFQLATGTVSVSVSLGTTNVKLDVVNGNEVWTNANLTGLSANIREYHALGISAVNLTGTAANESFFGNAGANVLVAGGGNDLLRGGSGADTLNGGAGNDIYDLGGDPSDTIIDSAGIDTIRAGITRSLADYPTIERLYLTGTGNINGTGNALANNIQGNAGANVLSGGNGNDSLQGGVGADRLTGGSGNDYFVYATAADSRAGGYDTITDFKGSGADKIKLTDVYGGTLTWLGEASGFTGIGQVRIAQAGSDVNIAINLDNNNATYEMLIRLADTTMAQLSGSDFLL